MIIRLWSLLDLGRKLEIGIHPLHVPSETTVEGFPQLNFPDVCTNEPQPLKAFCLQHCQLATEKNVPTSLRDYLQYKENNGMCTCSYFYTLFWTSLAGLLTMSTVKQACFQVS